mgnify:CR=1 FL=1
MKRKHLPTTEKRNPRSADIDTLSTLEIADLINSEDRTVPEAVGSQRREIAAAIDVAYTAQKDWAARTAKERSNILRAWFNLMVENADDLGWLLEHSPEGDRLGVCIDTCHALAAGYERLVSDRWGGERHFAGWLARSVNNASLALMAQATLQSADLLALGVPTFGWAEGRNLFVKSGSGAEISRYLERRPDHLEDTMVVLRYFDAVNFAELVSCPTVLALGRELGVR